jgi:hypothetical protein
MEWSFDQKMYISNMAWKLGLYPFLFLFILKTDC